MTERVIETFDEAVEYAVDLIGSNFEKSIQLANAILDEPSNYTGQQAAITAQKLALHRYKIGVAAQQWKIKSAATKKPTDRLIKDSLMVAFQALEEVINTLKLTARMDHQVASN